MCMGALLSCALWGGAYPAIKIGYRIFHIQAANTPAQLMFAGTRFILAGVLAFLIGSILFKRPLIPKKSSILRIMLLGMLQTYAQYFFFYVGLAHTTGVKASIVESLSVFVALLIAALVFHQEKLTAKKIAGCGIGFLGVVVIHLNGTTLDLNMHLIGEGFVFFSTVAYALSSVLIKRFSRDEEPFTLSSWQFLFGGVMLYITGKLMPYAGFKAATKEETSFLAAGSAGIGVLLLLACISGIAYSVWGTLLKYNEVSRIVIYGFMTPIFGVLFSMLFLGETKAAAPQSIVVSLILVAVGTLLAQI